MPSRESHIWKELWLDCVKIMESEPECADKYVRREVMARTVSRDHQETNNNAGVVGACA